MNQRKSFIIILLIMILSLVGCKNDKINDKGYYEEKNLKYQELTEEQEKDKLIKNVIIIIGDGMGENHIEVTKLLNNLQNGDLDLDKMPYKGQVITSCINEKVTDSAAAATAYACGVKTTQGYVGKDSDGNDVKNIMEIAHEKGYKTGVVTTKYLADATPSGFSAHSLDRYNTEEIVQSQLKSNLDILMGGGYADYYKYNDLINQAGYTVISPSAKIKSLKEALMNEKSDKILGLFTNASSGWVPDEDGVPTLADMTKKAIDSLSKSDKGFVLMIEEGQIDNYCTSSSSRSQDINKMASKVIALDKALRVALNYARSNNDTLVIVIADHETGGLQIKEGTPNNSWFTTDYHTSVNVGIRTFGLHSRQINNKTIDNTDVFKLVIKYMGLE